MLRHCTAQGHAPPPLSRRTISLQTPWQLFLSQYRRTTPRVSETAPPCCRRPRPPGPSSGVRRRETGSPARTLRRQNRNPADNDKSSRRGSVSHLVGRDRNSEGKHIPPLTRQAASRFVEGKQCRIALMPGRGWGCRMDHYRGRRPRARASASLRSRIGRTVPPSCGCPR
jgi:hypothetical protein